MCLKCDGDEERSFGSRQRASETAGLLPAKIKKQLGSEKLNNRYICIWHPKKRKKIHKLFTIQAHGTGKTSIGNDERRGDHYTKKNRKSNKFPPAVTPAVAQIRTFFAAIHI